MSMQEAVDEVGRMLEKCFDKWHKARASIPSWGEDTDEQVRKLLNVFRDVTLGCLYWR